jgi:hypothetical protein
MSTVMRSRTESTVMIAMPRWLRSRPLRVVEKNLGSTGGVGVVFVLIAFGFLTETTGGFVGKNRWGEFEGLGRRGEKIILLVKFA